MSGPVRAPPAPAGADTVGVHGTALVVGERGALIRGRSGSGKTRLALALVERARLQGRFARLVGDDRVLVAPRGGRLVARPHPALAGLVERRGLGILPVEAEPACVLALVVDLVEGPVERLPPPGALHCTLAGVALARAAIASGTPPAEAAALADAALGPEAAPYFACQSDRDAQDCAGVTTIQQAVPCQRHER